MTEQEYLEKRKRVVEGFEAAPCNHVDVNVYSSRVTKQRLYLFPYNRPFAGMDEAIEARKVEANYFLFVHIAQPEAMNTDEWQMVNVVHEWLRVWIYENLEGKEFPIHGLVKSLIGQGFDEGSVEFLEEELLQWNDSRQSK